MRALVWISLATILASAAFGPSTETAATSEIADISTSPRSITTFMRTSTRPGRYELRNASMLDLIRTAYAFDADKVLAGPNWLEYDHEKLTHFKDYGCTACHRISLGTVGLTEVGAKLQVMHFACTDVQNVLN